MRRLVTVRCAACERKFKPGRKDARYCSAACRQKAYRARAVEDELVCEIEATRLRYWRLIGELAAARGTSRGEVLTHESQSVAPDGTVTIRGQVVGKMSPPRPGWSTWGLEAAGPPFCPPHPSRHVTSRQP